MLFGGGAANKQTTKEVVRKTKRDVTRSQRELERERRALERDEKKLMAEIKRAAKRDGGDSKNVKILAKQLMQLRASRDRLIATGANLGAIKNQATVMGTQASMAKALGSAAGAMKTANTQMDMGRIQQTLRTFAQESARMEMSQEMMEDALGDAFDNSEDEEEADDMVNAVLGEIGIDMAAMMAEAPSQAPGRRHGNTTPAAGMVEADDAALDAEAEALMARLTAM